MRAGYIYFAETSTPYIKVGRFFEHLSVADKEAVYRRLDPGFRIRYAYWCDDVVAEEKRVLMVLRLVGGTAVKSAGRECFEMGVEAAVRAAGDVSRPAREALARKLIVNHTLGSKTIGALLEQAGKRHRDGEPLDLSAFPVASMVLMRAGIFLGCGDASLGIASKAYATVVDEKLLFRTIPALKKLGIPLEGLAVY